MVAQGQPSGDHGQPHATRAEHLEQIAELLWPSPHSAQIETTGRGVARPACMDEYFVVPSARHPRLLLPARHRRAATAVALAHNVGGSRADRLRSRGLAALLRSGLASAAFRDRLRVYGEGSSDSDLLDHLRGILETDIVMSVAITRPRANRKPVLQLLSARSGRPIAFVKVATGPLTLALMARESAALSWLAKRDLGHIQTPSVLYHGPWRALQLLVLSALPTGNATQPPPSVVGDAMVQVAGAAGVRRQVLGGSPYWSDLCRRVKALADPAAQELQDSLVAIGQRHGDAMIPFGCWHGDWAPWNMAWSGRQLLVWDWERFESDVPAGFDALHFDLQTRIGTAAGDDVQTMILGRLGRIEHTLRPWELAGETARLIGSLYLAEIAARWMQDRQERASMWSAALATIIGERSAPARRGGADAERAG